MDDRFEIPIVGYRIGLDPILGLIPGGGDWVAWVAGVYVFWSALRLDVPDRILWRMVGNITVDLVLGYVPAAGDVVDALYKSNRKNVDLLLDHYDAHDRHRTPSDLPAETESSSSLVRYAFGAGVTLVLTLLAALPFLLVWWLASGG